MAIDITTGKMEVEVNGKVEWRTYRLIQLRGDMSSPFSTHREPDLKDDEIVCHLIGDDIPKILRVK